MMATWMLYGAFCAIGLSLGAVLAERALLAGRAPVRYVWILAIILSLAVPLASYRYAQQRALETPDIAVPTLHDAALIQGLAAISTAPTPATVEHTNNWQDLLRRADQPLAAVWIALSLFLAVRFAVGMVVLNRARRRWRRQVVLGVPVLVSERTGPALCGVIAPAIVLPEWALALTSEELALMLRHEQEHQRTHDGQLLLAAHLTLVAMPWNLALWWLVMRLRVAVELDCDARVLQKADPRSYGALLLEVVRPRRALVPMGAAAFAERATQLERRIRIMASQPERALRGARVMAGLVAVAAVAIAWVAPKPRVPAETASAVQPPVPERSARVAVSRLSPTTSIAQRADDIYGRLFGGLTLTPGQATEARRVITRLVDRQSAQQAEERPAFAAFGTELAAVTAQRDSALLRLMTSEQDRATLAARLTPGGRRGGGGAGGRGTVAGFVGGSVARGGGTAQRDTLVLADAAFRRLFEGIVLSPDQETAARQAVLRAQAQVRTLIPPRRAPTLVAPLTSDNRVVMEATAAAALLALITDDNDRAVLRARMIPSPQPTR